MKIKSYYLFVLLFLIPLNSLAQFTYLDFGMSQTKIIITGSRLTTSQTKLNVTEFHVGGLWRFSRFFGLGGDLGIPVKQKSAFSFRNTDDQENPYRDDLSIQNGYVEERYIVNKFDYTFKQSLRLGLVGRVYFGGTSNWFLDLKVSASRIKDDLVLERAGQAEINTGYLSDSYPAVEALSIHETHNNLFIVPGFAIGWQPHLGKKFFMNMNLGYDIYKFKSDDFSYTIPYGTGYIYDTTYESQSNYEKTVKITSPSSGTKIALSGNLRFGYFF